ncbi:MAG: histidinol-phosphate transaminase [Pseudopedobacter saltans]|uniref:Histidinol-phosphate aminotransferase n=1 Tax=Pseudopedobacter saltans TaxID=151895 RepID=A0A2W5FDT2_9SPHI|nr:MAG: histidinol-phosphate transaminase [Pseudopedobacter saltans]
MSFNINNLVKENIKSLAPYSSARDEFSGEANIFLDANENSLGSPLSEDYTRYPDPHQRALKQELAKIKQVLPENIFLGNGSDECIDLLYRCFCQSQKDNVIICPPTYGMYEVSANINDVEIRKAQLTPDFQLDLASIKANIDNNTKIIWICSPNNPSGNLLKRESILSILNDFQGLVVVDEAYIDFANQESFTQQLAQYPNLVVMQTFSKAWGMAGLRLGMAFASKEIISILDRVKPPYNINQVTQQLALEALANWDTVKKYTVELIALRNDLASNLEKIPLVKKIHPSDANFLLVEVTDAQSIYDQLLQNKIVVRDRHKVILCDNCLRLTVGTKEENNALEQSLKQIRTVASN